MQKYMQAVTEGLRFNEVEMIDKLKKQSLFLIKNFKQIEPDVRTQFKQASKNLSTYNNRVYQCSKDSQDWLREAQLNPILSVEEA